MLLLITIATLNAAFYMRLTRNQLLEVFGEDYIRTARAKGLRERTVVIKHGLRAGLTPIVTAAGLDLAYLLGGAIITENIFNLPGLALPRDRVRPGVGPAADHGHHARRGLAHHLCEPGR
jgi:peptide/nickel transport system permease protein